MLYDWDWAASEASLRRALELAPGDVQVMRYNGVLLGHLGRMDEAIPILRRAVALDPLNVQVYRSLAAVYFRTDRFEESEAMALKALEVNPKGGIAHCWLGAALLMQGRLDEALEAVTQEPHDVFRLLGTSLVQHARGRPAESKAALDELIATDSAGGAYQIAEAFAYRGETEAAFEWLERAYEQRDPGTPLVKMDPIMRNLHGDPRWQAFLEKMRLA
jgi:tetratricopeptide (TPR) repeat protein